MYTFVDQNHFRLRSARNLCTTSPTRANICMPLKQLSFFFKCALPLWHILAWGCHNFNKFKLLSFKLWLIFYILDPSIQEKKPRFWHAFKRNITFCSIIFFANFFSQFFLVCIFPNHLSFQLRWAKHLFKNVIMIFFGIFPGF